MTRRLLGRFASAAHARRSIFATMLIFATTVCADAAMHGSSMEIATPEFGWAIGLSRANLKHYRRITRTRHQLRCLSFAQITSKSVDQPFRILGATSHFDVEKLFGPILAATLRLLIQRT